MGCFEEKLPTPGHEGKKRCFKVASLSTNNAQGHCEVRVFELYHSYCLRYPSQGKDLGMEFASRILVSGSAAKKCLKDIANALQHSGIELLMYHGEAAPGRV